MWSFDFAHVAEVIRLVSGLVLALGVWLAFLNLRNGSRAAELSARQQEVTVLSQVQDRWGAVYEARNTLRTTTYDHIHWDAMKPEDILKSDVWLEVVRPVANFYEFMGLIICRGYIEPSVALVLVTADTQSRANAAPIIDALRRKYRTDLYTFWDELIRMSKDVKALTPEDLRK